MIVISQFVGQHPAKGIGWRQIHERFSNGGISKLVVTGQSLGAQLTSNPAQTR